MYNVQVYAVDVVCTWFESHVKLLVPCIQTLHPEHVKVAGLFEIRVGVYPGPVTCTTPMYPRFQDTCPCCSEIVGVGQYPYKTRQDDFP